MQVVVAIVMGFRWLHGVRPISNSGANNMALSHTEAIGEVGKVSTRQTSNGMFCLGQWSRWDESLRIEIQNCNTTCCRDEEDPSDERLWCYTSKRWNSWGYCINASENNPALKFPDPPPRHHTLYGVPCNATWTYKDQTCNNSCCSFDNHDRPWCYATDGHWGDCSLSGPPTPPPTPPPTRKVPTLQAATDFESCNEAMGWTGNEDARALSMASIIVHSDHTGNPSDAEAITECNDMIKLAKCLLAGGESAELVFGDGINYRNHVIKMFEQQNILSRDLGQEKTDQGLIDQCRISYPNMDAQTVVF